MLQIPREGPTPLIKLFQNLSELQKETGQKVFHGTYDPATNTILATLDSVAHEIGHYRDFKSGKIKNPNEISEPHKRIEARLRNEIVAILFASSKVGDAGTSLAYEIEFMTWLDFMRAKDFGPHSQISLKELKLQEIQDLAEFIANTESPWFEKLEFLFRDYLKEEYDSLTYSVRS